MRFVDARHRTLALIGAVVALPAAAIAAAPAAADSSRPQEVLAALQSQPVYVAPSVLDQLDRVAANRLQLRIAKKDVGRIHIAVIPLSWAADAGGVAAFGRAMDADTPEPGALLVIASSAKREDGYVITSHNHATAAADAVRKALASSDALEPQLSRAIDALTEVDPGSSGDINQASSPGAGTPSNPPFKIPDPNKIINTVNDTIKWTVIAIIVAILSPFLYIGWRIFRAGRRQREDDAETFADAKAAADKERDALGDDIVDLDVPTSMPNVPPAARAAYERALDAFDSSELALKNADSRRRLNAVAAQIAKGRQDAAAARAVIATEPTT